jgi:hypothetical protein
MSFLGQVTCLIQCAIILLIVSPKLTPAILLLVLSDLGVSFIFCFSPVQPLAVCFIRLGSEHESQETVDESLWVD